MSGIRYGGVTSVQTARTADDPAMRLLVASHLAEIFRYRVMAPDLVDSELARYSLFIRAGAGALDTADRPAWFDFAEAIIKRARPTGDLVRVSGTCPRGRDLDIRPLMHAFVVTIAANGMSGWIVLDLRKKRKVGGQHFYGLAATAKGMQRALARMWIEASGCSEKGVRTQTIRGWPEFTRTGNSTKLRTNLVGHSGAGLGVIGYALKPLPRGTRDLDLDVAACGWLADIWRAFRVSKAARVATPIETALVTPLHHGATAVTAPRLCPVCRERRLTRRQQTCGGRCRTRKHRAQKGARNDDGERSASRAR